MVILFMMFVTMAIWAITLIGVALLALSVVGYLITGARPRLRAVSIVLMTIGALVTCVGGYYSFHPPTFGLVHPPQPPETLEDAAEAG